DGGRYDPVIGGWRPVATNNAPSARHIHTAVWSGSEVIIWGGSYQNNFTTNYFNDGGRYNPAANTWMAVTTTGAPAGRELHTAVWTGSEMIVWSGYRNGRSFNDTWSYTPGRVMFLYLKP